MTTQINSGLTFVRKTEDLASIDKSKIVLLYDFYQRKYNKSFALSSWNNGGIIAIIGKEITESALQMILSQATGEPILQQNYDETFCIGDTYYVTENDSDIANLDIEAAKTLLIVDNTNKEISYSIHKNFDENKEFLQETLKDVLEYLNSVDNGESAKLVLKLFNNLPYETKQKIAEEINKNSN